MQINDMRTEKLAHNMEIFVSKKHVFTSDALLLANFASPKRKDKACDLGTGCGIIPLIWHRDFSPSVNIGVEISENACSLFKNTLEINNISDRIQCINADLRHIDGILPYEYFDVVTINPPYKKRSAGIANENEEQKNARHEYSCTLSDAVSAAYHLLKFGGRFVLCHRPERLCDIFLAMRENHIEPKRLREIVQRKGGEPSLVLVEGRKGGNAGMRICPVFYIENEDGSYTKEAEDIFYAYKYK